MACEIQGGAVMKLTDRQERFIDEYLIDLNGTQAAIRAGYSERTANEQAARLLAKVSIQRAIAEAMKKRQVRTQITQDDVIRDLCEVRDICLGRKKVRVVEVLKADGKISAEEIEKSFFDPAGANRALELLGKHMKMFTDKFEHTGSVDIISRIIEARKTGRITPGN